MNCFLEKKACGGQHSGPFDRIIVSTSCSQHPLSHSSFSLSFISDHFCTFVFSFAFCVLPLPSPLYLHLFSPILIFLLTAPLQFVPCNVFIHLIIPFLSFLWYYILAAPMSLFFDVLFCKVQIIFDF